MIVLYDDCEITHSFESGYRMEFVFKLCHKSAINNDIPLALQNDPKSPLYRIWQSTFNPSTGNVTQVSEKQRIFQDLFSSWKNKNQNEAQLFLCGVLCGHRVKHLKLLCALVWTKLLMLLSAIHKSIAASKLERAKCSACWPIARRILKNRGLPIIVQNVAIYGVM